MDKITFEDWQKLELKVGKILEVEKVEGADKLYKLQVDVGEKKPRQIVSGIVPYYTEEELKDRQIVVLTNLKPAKFRGEVSDGMLLAAGDDEKDICILLSPEKDAKAGMVVT